MSQRTISDPFANGKFTFEDEPIKLGGNLIPDEVMPFMVGKTWVQWCDPVIYDADKRMRHWLNLMYRNKTWRKSKMDRTYMFGELFELLFGRQWNAKKGGDTPNANKLARLFAYYCTSVKTCVYDRRKKKWVGKKGYVIATSACKKPAYSIKLRCEEYMDQGKKLDWRAVQLPKDDLKAGHSRDKRTEENMQWYRELCKERYREYLRNWRRDHPEAVREHRRKEAARRAAHDAVPRQDDRSGEQAEGDSA